MLDRNTSPETLLAVYGTLAPGRSNHNQLEGLAGSWLEGTVRGQVFEQAWCGYPGIILNADGPSVSVLLFHSPDLPKHWERLDAFEGVGYRRVLTQVSREDGDVDAYIYELAQEVNQNS